MKISKDPKGIKREYDDAVSFNTKMTTSKRITISTLENSGKACMHLIWTNQ